MVIVCRWSGELQSVEWSRRRKSPDSQWRGCWWGRRWVCGGRRGVGGSGGPVGDGWWGRTPRDEAATQARQHGRHVQPTRHWPLQQLLMNIHYMYMLISWLWWHAECVMLISLLDCVDELWTEYFMLISWQHWYFCSYFFLSDTCFNPKRFHEDFVAVETVANTRWTITYFYEIDLTH